MMFLQVTLFMSIWLCIKADDCSNPPVNATGSIKIPGPKINDSFGASEWTLSSLTSEYPNADAPHVSVSRHVFELETKPTQNFSDPTFPLTGCILFIRPQAQLSPLPTDNGTCTSTYTPTCLSEIISTINTTAASISSTTNSTSASSCSMLADKLTSLNTAPNSACKTHFSSPASLFLSAPNPAYLHPIDAQCATPPNANVNGNASSSSIYAIGWTTFGNTEGDFVAYDSALITPIPMIVSTWAKMGSGSVQGWADTKVVCVTSNQVAVGSRGLNVSMAGSGSGSGSETSMSMSSATSTSTSGSVAPSKTASGGARTFNVGFLGSLVAVLTFGLVL